jgi:hypothetical protein
MAIQGTAVARFNNAPPVTMQGEWNISTGIPSQHFYGQGDGTPGSGYQGYSLGTRQNVSGAFKFLVSSDGVETKNIIRLGRKGVFAIDWPIGDELLGASRGKAIDCHFDTLDFGVNNPDGSYIISGTMTAGAVTGEAFD